MTDSTTADINEAHEDIAALDSLSAQSQTPVTDTIATNVNEAHEHIGAALREMLPEFRPQDPAAQREAIAALDSPSAQAQNQAADHNNADGIGSQGRIVAAPQEVRPQLQAQNPAPQVSRRVAPTLSGIPLPC